MVLCLLHSCLGQELSDREIPLTAADQAAFLSEVLRRSCCDAGELPSFFPSHSPAQPCSFPYSNRVISVFELWPLLPISSTQSLASAGPATSTISSIFTVGTEVPPVGSHRTLKDQAVRSTQATGDATLSASVSTGSSPYVCHAGLNPPITIHPCPTCFFPDTERLLRMTHVLFPLCSGPFTLYLR